MERKLSKFQNRRFERQFKINQRSVNQDARTVELSFSSETPVERDFGLEILDHSEGAVNLARLQTGGALLVDHDQSKHVGVIEQVTISNRRGVALVRFGRGAHAEEIFQDVSDGIRSSVSIGYLINEAVREEGSNGEVVYRVTQWQPYEISLVSVPADASVGVGRSMSNTTMNDTVTTNKPNSHEARKEERKRVMDITRLGKKYGLEDQAERAIEDDTSLQDFRGLVLDKLNSEPGRAAIAQSPLIERSPCDIPNLDKFSLTNVIRAMAGDNTVNVGFEAEVSQELSRRMGKRTVRGLLVPTQALRSVISGADNKDSMIGVAHQASAFVEILRNRSILMRLSPTMLEGLTADISIPRQSSTGSAYWCDLDGSGTITESGQRFDAIKMEMRTLAGLATFSHKMLKQSTPGIEQLVRQDLAAVVATELDRAAIAGTGKDGQPLGILGTTGIHALTYDTSPSFADVVGMEGAIASSSADVASMAYISNPLVATTMKSTPKVAGAASFIWEGGSTPGEGIMNTYRAMYSATVPADTTVFGNWSDLVIGQWGAIELDIDQGGEHFAKGNVRVRVISDVDIGVRHPESFAVLTKKAAS